MEESALDTIIKISEAFETVNTTHFSVSLTKEQWKEIIEELEWCEEERRWSVI